MKNNNLPNPISLYGYKGANLISLSNLIQTKSFDASVKIPPFINIETGYYDCWRKDLTLDFNEFYDWIGGFGGENHVIIRSSAEFSEGEFSSGAGVYKSKVVSCSCSYDDFVSAIIECYESVESALANSYRNRLDIPKERMGLIIQLVAYGTKATVRSRLASQGGGALSNLMEISFSPSARLIIYRDKFSPANFSLDKLSSNANDFFHFVPENLDSFIELYSIIECLQSLIQIEEIWNLHNHTNHRYELEVFFSDDKESELVLLQIRRLPFLKSNFSWPKIESAAIWEGLAFGSPVDQVLLTAHPYSVEPESEGLLVVFNESHLASVNLELDGSIDEYFPSSGAILILTPSFLNHSHIETRAIERGLICLYAKHTFSYSSSSIHGYNFPHFDNIILNNNKIRVVSDGVKAALYKVD